MVGITGIQHWEVDGPHEVIHEKIPQLKCLGCQIERVYEVQRLTHKRIILIPAQDISFWNFLKPWAKQRIEK